MKLKALALLACSLGAASVISACGSSGGSGEATHGSASSTPVGSSSSAPSQEEVSGSSATLNGAAASALLQKVKSSHELTIGTSNDPPWSYVSNGKALGIIPDILRQFLKDEGITATINSVAMPFNSLIPSIQSGRIQLIGDAMYANPQRAQQVAFSTVIFYNPEALVVKSGNPDNVSTLADLCGKSGGTYQGTVWVSTLQTASKQCPQGKSINVKTYATIDNVMSDISAGRLTAGLIDSSIAAYALHQNSGLGIELSEGYKPPDKAADDNALAVSKANSSFNAVFNAWFKRPSTATFMQDLFKSNGLVPTSKHKQTKDLDYYNGQY